MNRFFLLLLLVAVSEPASAAPASVPKAATPRDKGAKPATLDALAREAVKLSPGLQQLAARVKVARAKVGQAKAWPDPTFGVALMNMPFWPASFNATPMTGLQLSITQPIHFPTKRSLAGRVAASRARVPAELLKEARLQLAGLVRVTALELAYLRAELRITLRHAKLLDSFIQLALARYRVNVGLLQDLLKARVARSRIPDTKERIARRREGVEAAVNALIGRSITAKVTAPKLPSPRRVSRSLQQLVTLARHQRPVLAAWGRRIQTAHLMRKLARTGYYPDFGVRFAYRYRQDSGMDPVEGMDFWSIGVTIKIPLFSIGRTRARIREAEAVILRDRHGLRATWILVQKQLRLAFDAIRRLDRRALNYRKRILPEARRTLQAAIAAYTTGKVAFLSVLDQQRALLRFETALWRIRVERAKQWERLRAAVGGTP